MNLELNATNLIKRFGARQLFSIDTLNLKEGDSIHLNGDNGVGKTTLMKILAGLDEPCEGQVSVTPVKRKLWSSNLHPRVIYLHQSPYIFSGTVRENLAYGLKLRGSSRQQTNDAVDKALSWSRLEPLAHQQAYSLSGGEKQRLALARAWVLNPGLLFLDEPTANLDKKSVQNVAELVADLQNCGTAIMVSSHQSNPVTELCKQNMLLSGGQLKKNVANEALYA